MRALFFILALCIAPSLAQAQSISVQWTRLHPRGFEAVKNWGELPSKPDPELTHSSRKAVDDAPGWVAAVKIGTRILSDCDHYAVVQSPVLTSYCWRDDSEFYYLKLGAEVCTYSPLRCKTIPLSDFVILASALIRHGKWVPDALWLQHKALWK